MTGEVEMMQKLDALADLYRELTSNLDETLARAQQTSALRDTTVRFMVETSGGDVATVATLLEKTQVYVRNAVASANGVKSGMAPAREQEGDDG